MRVALRISAVIAAVALACGLVAAEGVNTASVASADVTTAPSDGGAAASGAIRAVVDAVRFTEIAGGGPTGAGGAFFELAHVGPAPVSLDGWAVYRCNSEGLRSRRTSPEISLDDVVLRPGETFTAAHADGGREGRIDATFRTYFARTGYGLVLVGPGDVVADAVAVYPGAPAPTESECDGGVRLPVTLARGLDESWQRDGDAWTRAIATPGETRVGAPTTRDDAPVRIDEIAPAGAGGSGDDIVELRASATADISGWRLYRCTAHGTLDAGTLRHEFPPGTVVAAGDRLVVGGPDARGPVDVRVDVSLADVVSGAVLVDADGRRVDGVTVSSHLDTACQTGDGKLAATLDHRTGESWQRTADGTFVTGPRTPGEPNVTQSSALIETAGATSASAVALSEVATDPVIDGQERHNFVELGNYGTTPVDLSRWRLIACDADGYRRLDDLAVVPPGTILAPGETWLAALKGTAAAGTADARYDRPLALDGAGVWVEDAAGRRVDSIGIFHRNEMDESVEPESPCTNGLSQATFAVDRLAGETYQRSGFTGSDVVDFTPGPATPESIDRRPDPDAAVLARAATARAMVAAGQAGAPAATSLDDIATVPTPGIDAAAATATSANRAVTATVLDARTGVSDGELAARTGAEEVRQDADDPRTWQARDDAYARPYVRLRIAVPRGGGDLTWDGRTMAGASVRLSVWSPVIAAWRALDEVATAHPDSLAGDPVEVPVTLTGRIRADEAIGGAAEVLVQVVRGDAATLGEGERLADPAAYDFALSHITDTQYYSEAYPEAYAAQVSWVAAERDARKIAFSVHSGDLIQNWVDPDQREERARHEYATASRMQAVLDDAGVPNSVLPGNHDNKRGVTDDLFNEYFPPSRYEGEDYYGGSLAPGDNSANWTRFSSGGAEFVVVSLPYGYGERELAWADEVIAAHPAANVIVATHEHLTPADAEEAAERSTTSRWLSRGDVLWERLVEPHRHVVMVLSGHFHGIGTIVSHDVGGVPGRTVVEALADYQEFRTATGERATGFQRLLQFDLSAERMAVDTFSVPLGATVSHPYDYAQFVPDDGLDTTPSNERPWRVLEHGLQQRYDAADDAFGVDLALQHPKSVTTDAVALVGDHDASGASVAVRR